MYFKKCVDNIMLYKNMVLYKVNHLDHLQ